MKSVLPRLALIGLVLQSASAWAGESLVSKKIHQIKVLNGGLSSYAERLAMIERAKRTIEVEYFLYDTNDVSARVLTQALAKKAASGVQVRILVDGLSLVVHFDPYISDRLKEAGVQVRHFNPDSPALHMLSHRNHRKALIVDGREFLVGGRNIEDKYFDLDADYNFLDRDVWVQGPIATQVQASFYRVWESKLSKEVPKSRPIATHSSTKGNAGTIDGRIKHRRLTEASRGLLAVTAIDRQVRDLALNWHRTQGISIPVFRGPVAFITDYDNGGVTWSANKKNEHVWNVMLENLHSARQSVLIETPYLVLRPDALELISQLSHRGIQIEVLTNSPLSTDSKITSTVYYGAAEDIAKRGAEVSCYDSSQPKKYPLPKIAAKARWGIHSKTLVVDGKHTAIGTYNLDPRSQTINVESMVYFPDNPEIAKYVSSDIRRRMKQGFSFYQLNPETNKVEQLRPECQGMTWVQCMTYRLKRPIGKLLIDTL